MGDSRAGQVLWHLHRWLDSATTSVDDGPLLDRFIQQRDEDAFAELVSRHGPLVFGLCRRLLGNVQDAEDVFQATFLVLARKAASIRKPESLSCWLHGVAYRLAHKARIEIERRRIHERQAAPPANSVEADFSWREVRGLLDEELQRLPEKQRLPLILCYLEGLTQDEASRRLGWPRGTLKRRLESGRERLRLRLTRRGVTLGASLFAAALTESATRGAVPMTLRSATVRAAMQFLTEGTAALAATPVVLLAKGALQTMAITKLKLGAIAILLFGCIVTAAGLAIPQAPPEKQPKNQAETIAQTATDKQDRKDRYGDPLPPGAVARLGTLHLRHQNQVLSGAFTRDGKTVIAGDRDGCIVYWDVATGRAVRRLQKIPLDIRVLAISHDGKTLACGGWGRAKLYFWDIEAGKLLSQHELDTREIRILRFSPDDKTLVVGDWGKVVRVWDVASRKVTHEFRGHARMFDGIFGYLGEQTGVLSDVAFSPDGKTLASCSDEDPNIRLWDIAGGKEKLHFKPHSTAVSNLAYSPDGKTIVSCGYDKDGPRFVFSDANTGKKLREVKDEHWKDNHLDTLQSFQYAPDGKTLFCAEIGGARVRDAVSGKELRRLAMPSRRMNRLAFSPDGKILATFGGGGQHAFELWDVAGGKPLHPVPGHRHYITSLVFSTDGRQVFSVADGAGFPVQVWDARTGERLYELGKHPDCPTSLALSPDGKFLAASCYYEANTGDAIGLWDLASRKQARRFLIRKYEPRKGHNYDMPIDWSADGKTLLVSSPVDSTIRLCDAATGKQLRAIDSKQKWGASILLSPDGKIVAAGGYDYGAIRLWSAETGKELQNLVTAPQIPSRIVHTLAFSPDGSALVCALAWGTIQLWSPATGRLLRQWETKTDEIGGLAFARDGLTLVSAHEDGSIHLWEPATGKERAFFRGHRGGVKAVAISRDGRYIASGGNDTTILVWDTAAGVRADAALSPEQLWSLWEDLNANDAGRAYRAMWQFALSPNHALPFLSEKLHPVTPLDGARQKQVSRLLAELDSEQFAVRRQAEIELEKMGPTIEPALQKAMESKPSLELRRRIEKIQENLVNERLRIGQALEAIEHMNTSESLSLLEALANGAPSAWLTQEARTIRKRLIGVRNVSEGR